MDGLPPLIIAVLTLLQRSTPPHLQGRTFAAFDVATTGPQTLGIALGAALITSVDYRAVLAAEVLVLGCCAAILLRTVHRGHPTAADDRATITRPGWRARGMLGRMRWLVRGRGVAQRWSARGRALAPRWLTRRRALAAAGTAVVLAAAAVVSSVLWVRAVAGGYLYSPGRVPSRPVALVLGSRVYADGAPAPVLADRLETARQLYARGAVRAVLVSGDNGRIEYNEVDPMRAWLVDRGVPADKVVGDYAGFDTYSSCVRAVKIFGVRAAVVVTQRYHLGRAVALCRKVGLDAVGASAGTAGLDRLTLTRLALRDDVACVKAVVEVVVRPDPRYLGRHETGVETALAGP